MIHSLSDSTVAPKLNFVTLGQERLRSAGKWGGRINLPIYNLHWYPTSSMFLAFLAARYFDSIFPGLASRLQKLFSGNMELWLCGGVGPHSNISLSWKYGGCVPLWSTMFSALLFVITSVIYFGMTITRAEFVRLPQRSTELIESA